MTRLQSTIGLAAILLSAACTTARTPTEADDLDCAAMCEVFRLHHCRAGDPSPRLGISCERRCFDQFATGAVKPPIDCVRHATSPEGIRACGERCSQ